MPKAVASPRPVPLPTSLVVKNGSKIRGRISGGMPQPVSLTLTHANEPGRAGEVWAAVTSSNFTAEVSMMSWPPLGMASRALTVRFLRLQQTGLELNCCQDVVESVRHAAGELADGLHLLRLPQLILEPPALGDVYDHSDPQGRSEEHT